MISLLVDSAYAFDYLAILQIKMQKYPKKELAKFRQLSETYEECLNYIGSQIDNLEEILESVEYKKLKEANIKTFNAVEEARFGNISAKEVDDCNLERFEAKNRLQSRFFPKERLKEFKNK
jgi:hypothetical protein